MSTIKSSDEHLTLNADGSSKDIKFQANGVEKASISSSGAFTSTTIDATKLTGALPAISGAALTGVGVAGITSTADSTAITIDSAEQVTISNSNNGNNTTHIKALNASGDEANLRLSGNVSGAGMGAGEVAGSLQYFNNTDFIASISGMRDGGNEGQLSFKTRGGSDSAPVEQLKITKEGYVTMPNQPCAMVTGSSGGYVSVSSGTAAPFNNIEHQTGGSNYNTSNYRYTAPIAGWYQVSFGVLSSAQLSAEWIVNKNGAHVFRCYQYDDRGWYATATVYCSASDYVELVSNASNSNNLYSNSGVNAYSWACYRLLG